MAKHCPICNRSSEDIKFYGEFCEICASDKLREKLPDTVEVERCKICGKIRTREGMREENRQSVHLVLQSRIKNYVIHVLEYEPGKAVIEAVEEGRHGKLTASKDVILTYKKITCESCYKKIGGYHEAVFQLRGDPERIQRFIERFTRWLENREEYIARVDKAEGGVNAYISSKTAANAFIHEREIVAKASYTLMGLKNGKRVYKNTYAIRL